MLLKYKFRLNPTEKQEIRLNQIAGSCRWVWNYFLDQEQKQYKVDKKFRFLNQNSRDLTALKKATGTEWLSESPATSLQQTLVNLERSLKQSFKRGNTTAKGFPKFKARKNFEASFTLAMVNAGRNISESKFHIGKDLDIKVILHRELPSDFKTCQIKKEGTRWFVVLTCEKEKVQLPKTGKSVGIDLNSKSYVLSNGTRFAIPKYLKENQFQIKKLQRQLSKKVKGSKNRKAVQLKLHKVHQSIANRRLDYFHKLSKMLVTEYDFISLEDLDVASIQRKMGHVTKDNGFGMFRQMIEYKSELYGKTSTIIDRWFPSSQTCSHCGAVHKMDLSERIYVCHGCDMIMDRDLNAAINIERAGTAPLNKAFGEVADMDQMKVWAVLCDLNEEGSHVVL
jgi:putative transposase